MSLEIQPLPLELHQVPSAPSTHLLNPSHFCRGGTPPTCSLIRGEELHQVPPTCSAPPTFAEKELHPLAELEGRSSTGTMYHQPYHVPPTCSALPTFCNLQEFHPLVEGRSSTRYHMYTRTRTDRTHLLSPSHICKGRAPPTCSAPPIFAKEELHPLAQPLPYLQRKSSTHLLSPSHICKGRAPPTCSAPPIFAKEELHPLAQPLPYLQRKSSTHLLSPSHICKGRAPPTCSAPPIFAKEELHPLAQPLPYLQRKSSTHLLSPSHFCRGRAWACTHLLSPSILACNSLNLPLFHKSCSTSPFHALCMYNICQVNLLQK